jgi:hypothetical protein
MLLHGSSNNNNSSSWLCGLSSRCSFGDERQTLLKVGGAFDCQAQQIIVCAVSPCSPIHPSSAISCPSRREPPALTYPVLLPSVLLLPVLLTAHTSKIISAGTPALKVQKSAIGAIFGILSNIGPLGTMPLHIPASRSPVRGLNYSRPWYHLPTTRTPLVFFSVFRLKNSNGHALVEQQRAPLMRHAWHQGYPETKIQKLLICSRWGGKKKKKKKLYFFATACLGEQSPSYRGLFKYPSVFSAA